MTLLIIYVSIALGFSFLCSVLEAVLLSISPSHIARVAEENPSLGEDLTVMKANVDRPLAAILTLNTIAHTVGAAGAGAQAQEVFGADLLAVISAVLTLLILVVSEIIPKTLGAVFWKQLTPFTVRTLKLMLIVLKPFIWMSEMITGFIKRGQKKDKVSKEEIAALARLGTEAGSIDPKEMQILSNLFRFGALKTRDIMTPRTVMFALPKDRKVKELVPKLDSGRISGEDNTAQKSTMVFSRIPVYGDSTDDVIGFVLKDDIFLKAAQDQLDIPIEELMRKIQVVHDTLPVAALFDKLVKEREQIALVVDEYGGVDGIVTMEDVIETLLGLEIVDEADRTVDMREKARARWRERRAAIGSIPAPPAAED